MCRMMGVVSQGPVYYDIFEEFADVVFGIGTHEGDYDDFFVAALESVCCVDFDVWMVWGEEVGQEFELGSVDRHNSNGGGWNAALS